MHSTVIGIVSPRGQLKVTHRTLLVKKYEETGSFSAFMSHKLIMPHKLVRIAIGDRIWIELLKGEQNKIFLNTLRTVPTRIKITLQKNEGRVYYEGRVYNEGCVY